MRRVEDALAVELDVGQMQVRQRNSQWIVVRLYYDSIASSPVHVDEDDRASFCDAPEIAWVGREQEMLETRQLTDFAGQLVIHPLPLKPVCGFEGPTAEDLLAGGSELDPVWPTQCSAQSQELCGEIGVLVLECREVTLGTRENGQDNAASRFRDLDSATRVASPAMGCDGFFHEPGVTADEVLSVLNLVFRGYHIRKEMDRSGQQLRSRSVVAHSTGEHADMTEGLDPVTRRPALDLLDLASQAVWRITGNEGRVDREAGPVFKRQVGKQYQALRVGGAQYGQDSLMDLNSPV